MSYGLSVIDHTGREKFLKEQNYVSLVRSISLASDYHIPSPCSHYEVAPGWWMVDNSTYDESLPAGALGMTIWKLPPIGVKFSKLRGMTSAYHNWQGLLYMAGVPPQPEYRDGSTHGIIIYDADGGTAFDSRSRPLTLIHDYSTASFPSAWNNMKTVSISGFAAARDALPSYYIDVPVVDAFNNYFQIAPHALQTALSSNKAAILTMQVINQTTLRVGYTVFTYTDYWQAYVEFINKYGVMPFQLFEFA